jgi:hypothetical protein
VSSVFVVHVRLTLLLTREIMLVLPFTLQVFPSLSHAG